MRVRISRRRNGAVVRLPDTIMDAAGFAVGQTVAIVADRGRIVIEPISKPKYDLDSLVGQMTPETAPDLIDFGPERGREAW